MEVYSKDFTSTMTAMGMDSMFGSGRITTKLALYIPAKKVAVATPAPVIKPTAPPKPTLTVPKGSIARTVTATAGGESVKVDFTSAMIKRGYANVFINNTQYRVSPDGEVTAVK